MNDVAALLPDGVVIHIDPACPNGDFSMYVDVKHHPDGTIEVVAMGRIFKGERDE